MTDDALKPTRFARADVLALVGLALAAAVLLAHALHFDFINDDAFISFRYADNLVRHGELTFNPGERVEGYTNFLWTMVMAGVLALGGDPVPWSKGLGVLLSCGTLGVLWTFSRAFARRQKAGGHHALWAALGPLLLGANSAFACWSEGGLETALYTFLLTLAWTRYVIEVIDDARIPWSGVIIALAAMTRPEALMVMALMGVHRLGVQAFVEKRWVPSRSATLWVALFLLTFVPYWLWRYNYYGFVFPNTYYAKAGRSLWEAGWRYTSGFIGDFSLWLAIPLIAVPWRRVDREWLVIALIALIAVPYGVYITRVGGDFMALYRFYVPLLPMFAFVAQEGLANIWTSLSEAVASAHAGKLPLATRVRGAALGLILMALVAHHNLGLTKEALEVGSKDGVDSIGWLKMFVGQTTAIGTWLRGAYPPETSIATTAAGVIPYYSRLPTLDLLALNDPYTAHTVEPRGKRPGHAKSAPEPYVLAWGPDLLIWHPRMSKNVPRAGVAEKNYWRARGYKFGYAQVPGLDPPYWAWFEKQ